MKIISSITALRKQLDALQEAEKTVGFVPTMGALHAGHLSLISQCRQENDVVVVSIFVNPIQFGPKEDFSTYPRDKKKDCLLAETAGCHILFYPNAHQLLPAGFNTTIDIPLLARHLCGAKRPDHFKGVATIVAKLFNIVMPDQAYFGQKDYQQLAIIKKMAADLNFPIKIKGVKTLREPDGLAMSSRNIYLSKKEREEAPVIYQALRSAKKMVSTGERDTDNITKYIRQMITKTSGRIDYIECVDAETLSRLKVIDRKAVIAVAVFFGKARLIDNILLQI